MALLYSNVHAISLCIVKISKEYLQVRVERRILPNRAFPLAGEITAEEGRGESSETRPLLCTALRSVCGCRQTTDDTERRVHPFLGF